MIEISSDASSGAHRKDGVKMTRGERKALIAELEKQMKAAAKMLEFELAAELRDRIIRLRGEE